MFYKIEGKPQIQYPCHGEYRTIGPDNFLMRAAIIEVLGDADYTLNDSHVSRYGRYCSMIVGVEVRSEEHRNEIFSGLSGHPDIRYVL